MKKRILGFTIAAMMLLVVFGLVGCNSTQGIPHGAYRRLDIHGNTINEGAEGAWIIRKDEAEHRYLKFGIVEIAENIYFEIERVKEGSCTGAESGLFRYEVKYDKKTEILTVAMPSTDGKPFHIPTNDLDIKEFQFKKIGINIG